jgi:hypothetical protein
MDHTDREQHAAATSAPALTPGPGEQVAIFRDLGMS